jgi:hypothetical protein
VIINPLSMPQSVDPLRRIAWCRGIQNLVAPSRRSNRREMAILSDSSPSRAEAMRDSGDDQKIAKGQRLWDAQPVNNRVQLIETTIAGI